MRGRLVRIKGLRECRNRLDGAAVYLKQQKVLAERLRAALRESSTRLKIESVVMEQPPEIKFGEYATSAGF